MSILSDETFHVTAIAAFDDNYIWLIDNGVNAVVIDPGDAAPVLEELNKRSLTLCAIVLTHRHDDHIGGVATLCHQFSIPVFGPINDPIPTVTHRVKEGDTVSPEGMKGLSLRVLDVPGHTSGHIAYFAAKEKWLFCGDMLFGAGCGRMFEGTPEMMVASIAKFAALPDETLVFAAHEYTLSNLRFAREIEPDNKAILQRIREDAAKREKNLPTLPSTIGLEKATNPFMRNTQANVIDRLFSMGRIQKKNEIDAFAALREWKNNYR